MIFKRRDRQPFWQRMGDFLWPRKGWGRALQYVKHRLSRLPDQPGTIARGVFAGIFVTFSPLFGLHLVLAAAIAWIIKGNVLAALLATFLGNPVTFVLIAAISLKIGYILLGREVRVQDNHGVVEMLGDTLATIYHNLLAPFSGRTANWSELDVFMDEVFLPYLIGGAVAGLFFGLLAHMVTVPLVRAYQKRRRAVIRKKWLSMRQDDETRPDK